MPSRHCFRTVVGGLAPVAALVLALGCASPDPAAPAVDARPNILLILADDLGLTDVGFFGGEIPTPNLNALAFEGLRLTNFHAAPACMQTRAMLMSGMTHREAGVVDHNDPIRTDVATLPERLRDLGYHTYMAGKWNLGLEADDGPAARGFESSFALMPAGDNHLGDTVYPDGFVAYRENGTPVAPPESRFSSELFTDKLISYLRARPDDGAPWFGFLSFTAPHWPLQVPDEWLDRHRGRYDEGYDALRQARFVGAGNSGVLQDGLALEDFEGRAPPWKSLDASERRVSARSMEIYASMVENMDAHVGRLVDFLETTGQLDDTLILFTSDNGASGTDSSFVPRTIPRTDTDNRYENMGRAGSFTAYGLGWSEAATAPYRGVKGSLHAGGTLGATFVRHTTARGGGGVDGTYLTVMDVLPTLVAIAGGTTEASRFDGRDVRPVRGQSFLPLLAASDEAWSGSDRVVPWMTAAHRRALVRWPWKIVTDQRAPPESAPSFRLFQLEDDPGERRDRAKEHPEVLAELEALWRDYADGLARP